MRIKTCLLLFIASVSTFTFSKQISSSEPTMVIENYQFTLDTIVPELLKKYKVPAAGVGIIRDGEVIVEKVYGQHQLGQEAPNNTIFNVASITKSIVAVTVMKLVENGDWDLDEPLSNYFTDPDIAADPRARELTTRHCLAHTTGFKNWRWHEEDSKLQFNFNPGEKYQYSGEGMEYVRKAIEKKFDTDFSALAHSLVFKPLGMSDTTLNWISDKDVARFAKWHDTSGNLHDVDHETPKTNAADDLLITVNDMLKFDLAVLNHKIISEESFNLMVSPQISVNNNINQSLGWVSLKDDATGIYLINHDGGDTGVIATNIIFPNSNDAIAIFTNGNNGASVTNSIIKDVLNGGLAVVKKLRWENNMPEIIELKQESLDRFTGVYKTNRGFDIQIIKDGNQLMTVSTVYPRQTIYAISKDEFVPIPFEVYFTFKETEKGRILTLSNPNREVELEGILNE